ncbi:MAG: acetylornithine transaminase [Burkholderiales bacterium]|nr:acetylornithine transaminase [Burkholderiales bacterium]
MGFEQFPAGALMNITTRPELIFVRGQGSWLWDHEGRRYLDFVQGWAVNCLGHSPQPIADALAVQAHRLITPSPAFYNEPSIRLADWLVRHSCFDRVFFTNSGAEANEGAIKLARKYGARHREGAYEIITFDGAFHGRTLATMSASGKKQFDALFEPKVPGFPRARLNDLASVEALLGPRTVGVMLEPIQGEAGVWPATVQFLRDLRALTAERGILLIVDEVQTGMGRTGDLFGYEHAGIEPDIMSLGKGIGGGVPLGAMLARESVSCFEPGDQGGTYNGNPLMCAVGLAVAGSIGAPEFLDGVRRTGEHLRGRLEAFSRAQHLGEVRGRGLLLALDLGQPIGGRIVDAARARGLLINSPRPECLRFMPALNVTHEEVDAMIEILAACVTGPAS